MEKEKENAILKYFMNYGWALLVVLLTIALLVYFGIIPHLLGK